MAGKIDENLVRHIALLSRLKPADEEVRLFSEQLSAIVAYMDQLGEVDTSNVQPTAHALPVSSVFRADSPHVPMMPDDALSNAPQRDGHFFALPKVLDQDSA
jgi:aspartyl-tRNA(Asn)/glutamyl-tRNA(Gln) amidotransferase subunit C